MNAARALLAIAACAWIGTNLALLGAAFSLFSSGGLAITGGRAHSGKLFGLILADWSAGGGMLFAAICVLLAMALAANAGRAGRPLGAAAWVIGGLAALGAQLWYAELIATMNVLQDRIAHDPVVAATFRALHKQSLAAVALESACALLLALGALLGIASARSGGPQGAHGTKATKGADAH